MGANRNKEEAMFDHHGGEIKVAAYGFTLSVPSGAIDEGHPCTISIEINITPPRNLVLKDGELLISLPFKCSPSNLSFKKPVKISMPHCAVFHNTDEEVKFVHYWRESEDEGKIWLLHSYFAIQSDLFPKNLNLIYLLVFDRNTQNLRQNMTRIRIKYTHFAMATIK